jgi:DNA-binding FrmR family transcriptional regulator
MKHSGHPDIVKRLKRADGHLRSVIAMLEKQRSCLDIAQQLQAVESAVATAKKRLIRDHIEHCLEAAPGEAGRTAIAELKEIARYL